MVDFLFIYEIKNRELENICLLTHELNKRGYKVKIVESWRKINHNFPKIKAKVVVVFAGYDNNQLLFYGNYSKGIKKIVDLQWEQLYTVSDEENNSVYDIKEQATKIVHISWGNNNLNKLKYKCGIQDNFLCLAGNVTFDFLKPRFSDYYLSSKELKTKFNLLNQPVFLFISSFSFIGMPKESLREEVYSNLSFDPFEWQKVNVESQNTILDWFEDALILHPEITMVYRPHPAEVGCVRLERMEKKYPNFRVIRDLSVKQWILCADKIFTWYSTSIAEVYVAGKSCSILRPIEISSEMDVRIYHGCQSIKEKEAFLKDYSNTSIQFPLKVKTLNDYYSFGNNYSYLKICDKLIDVLNDDSYLLNLNDLKFSSSPFFKYPLRSIKLFIKRVMIKAYSRKKLFFKIANRNQRFSKIMENGLFAEKMTINNYASKKEIKRILLKIDQVLNKN